MKTAALVVIAAALVVIAAVLVWPVADAAHLTDAEQRAIFAAVADRM